MTVPALLVLSQLADGLSFGLAIGHGSELYPIGAALLAAGGLGLVWAVKGVAALACGLGAATMPDRRSLWLWLALVGFVGTLSNLVAAL